MIDSRMLDEFARKLSASMPASLGAIQQDMEKNLRAALESVFQRLDLVTREEFEVQTAVLARTREKLVELERRVAELEQVATPDIASDLTNE